MPKKTSKKVANPGFVPMPVVNPNAAGIDIGDTIHAVAVPQDRDQQSVRVFGTMSCDLKEIVDWLEKCGIDTIAMESTGVYWKPLFNYLILYGFDVYLVNAQHVRNVTGRKTDQSDAEWLQQLHSCGLVKSSYLPENEQETLRTLVRHRRTLTEESSRFVLRMQKALELMNIKLHTVISDIVGKSGTAIIEAIIAGERNAANFLPFLDYRIKASHEVIIKSLEGNWRAEQLFTLEENYISYKFFQQRIITCEKAIEAQLQRYAAIQNEGEIPLIETKKEDILSKAKKRSKNAPVFNTRSFLKNILGVDVLAIYGMSDICALEILSETGTDLGKWKNEKHFVSWLNLCPNTKKSGGKIISSKLMKKKPNSASQAFRMAANGVQRSDHWLGDYFRRMKAKGGNKYAIVATANKIATIYYKMVTNKVEFNPLDLQQYQEQRKNAKIAYLERKLESLKKHVA
ncbi:IS110 family transposase [Chitinophaga sp. LS1]|uniref:IS110 family transposase n=1 Tax=Chitinophaga sp. LS1 TaxID=3051176 RepID=UPI002AAB5ABD|nr:IS110 family transposase [Chitinophaga sp. LS1]WPV65941.1 IS110 family transposase [Chitinophaga sp. LS1]